MSARAKKATAQLAPSSIPAARGPNRVTGKMEEKEHNPLREERRKYNKLSSKQRGAYLRAANRARQKDIQARIEAKLTEASK